MKSIPNLFFIFLAIIYSLKIISSKKNDKSTIIITGAIYESNCIQVGIWPFNFNLSYINVGPYKGPIKEFEIRFIDMISAEFLAWCQGHTDNNTLTCISDREIEVEGEFFPILDDPIEEMGYDIKDFMMFNGTVGISIEDAYVQAKLYGKHISANFIMKEQTSDFLYFEFKQKIDPYSLPNLKYGGVRYECTDINNERLFCPLHKSDFPPRKEKYAIQLENVCHQSEVYINLTVSGTPHIQATGSIFKEKCSQCKAGLSFTVNFTSTDAIPEKSTKISDVIVLRNAEDNIPCDCTVNNHTFECTTKGDAQNEGMYMAYMDDDFIAEDFSINSFKALYPFITCKKKCE